MSEAAMRELFRRQAADCRALGSPFTALVMDHLAETLDQTTEVGRRVLSGSSDRRDAIPLRLAGALHGLALSGRDAGLGAVYPPNEPGLLGQALDAALRDQRDFLLPWLDNPPQTNEVGRSAILIAVGHWLTARFGLPLHLSELGASAGLNLLWDHYALDLPGLRLGPADPVLVLRPDWRGPLPPLAPPRILSRAGTDIAPLDPVADQLRLLAYTWPDQVARLERCKAALDLAAQLRPPIARKDAGIWAEHRLAQPLPGALHLIFHTIAAQYFPTATARLLASALEDAGARATVDSPLAHLAVEWDGTLPGIVVTLTLWPGREIHALGSIDAHGRWVEWHG